MANSPRGRVAHVLANLAPVPMSAPPRLALRAAEAAAALGIGRRLLWQQTNARVIPCVRIGRAVVYPVAVLEKWLADQAEVQRR